MLKHSFVPSDFRFGTIKPLLKDIHGDITSTDLYRAITLTLVMSKLFEYVLLTLYGEFLASDYLQYGFKKEVDVHMLFLHLLNLSYTLLGAAAKSIVPRLTLVRHLTRYF